MAPPAAPPRPQRQRHLGGRGVVVAWALVAAACDETTLLGVGASCHRDSACASAFCMAAPAAGGRAATTRCASPDADADADGVTNYAERLCGGDPHGVDTDGDGLLDGAEYGPLVGSPRDRDGDGKADLVEHDARDADSDCLRDVEDHDDAAVASPTQLAAVACTKGVCGAHATSASCVAAVIFCTLPAGVGFEPTGETRCDALDNDCDGETDEALDGKAGAGCGDTGVCLGAPTSRCSAGQWLCNLGLLPDYEPVESRCDGLDNDCDGTSDEAPVCDDGVACTKDSCAPGLGCQHDVDAAGCFDGNECTVDVCDGALGCRWLPRIGGCDDANPCTGSDACSAGVCKGGSATGCEDGSTCTANPCDPQSGCLSLPVAAGSACDPKLVCQQAGVCDKGACQPTVAVDCSDGNDCTADACSLVTGACVHVPANGPCDDGSECTEGDTCIGKDCVGVPLPTCCSEASDCDDGNPCTDEVCTAGACSYGPVTAAPATACDDGNPCTALSLCVGAVCLGTTPTSCGDGNPCTIDVCLPATGCVGKPLGDGAGCDDGNACNGTALCKAGACELGSAPSCDDGNPCTDDSCAAVGGCQHGHNLDSCDDGSACTRLDSCAGGSCKGQPLVCTDDIACTTDSCDVLIGCGYAPNVQACDDGDPCTAGDSCKSGGCQGGALACDDNNACTNDSCGAAGCAFDPDALQGHSCGDDSACTGGEVCAAGVCTVAVEVSCDDGNPCTASACDKKTGRCVQPTIGGACVTPTGCAADAACKQGVCSGTAIGSCCTLTGQCQDQNPCTLDSCDKTNGSCQHKALSGVGCSDGSACTLGDACQVGLCRGGVPLACDDANACTEDLCLPAKGCLPLPRPFAACLDGDVCNGAESCSGATCQASAPLSCDDGVACTADACQAVEGCSHSGLAGQTCDDGSACTEGDACDAKGSCSGQIAAGQGCCNADAGCDDGYACTLDHCDDKSHACVHAPRVCDDAGPCAVRACLDGACLSQSRCTVPALLMAAFEAPALPVGWSASAAGLGAWAPTQAGAAAFDGGKQALHVGLGVGTASARLPPLALPPGAYALRFKARVDADGGCAGGSLQALRGGQPLGPPLCATLQPQALDLPFELTAAAAQVQLELRFSAKGVVDPGRGAMVDDVVVVATPAAGCVCPPK